MQMCIYWNNKKNLHAYSTIEFMVVCTSIAG